MQGHNSSLITFTENLSFDPRPTPSVMQTTGENCTPECGTSSSAEANVRFTNQQQGIGEPSSGAGPSQNNCAERKREHSWSAHSQAHRRNLSDNPPFDGVRLSSNGDRISTGPSSLPLFASSEAFAFSRDLNICLNEDPEDEEDEDDSDDDDDANDDVRVIAAPDDRDRPGSSFDGRRISCKRKTLEAGPSSEAGNSSLHQDEERNRWDSSTYPQIVAANANVRREANPRLQLGGEGSMSSPSLSLRPFESSWNSDQRNLTPQIPPASAADLPSSSRHAARFYLHHCLFGPNQDDDSYSENQNANGRSVFSRALLQRRNSRSNGASTSRAHSSSESDNEDPITSEIAPRSFTGQSMLIPCNERGGSSTSQQPAEGILASGSNSNVRNVRTTSSRSGTSRISPMYHHRLSELVRRSRLSSANTESNSSSVVRQAPTSLQEMPASSGSTNSRRHLALSSRSSFYERNLEHVLEMPHSSRGSGDSGEGRSSFMSEDIRHVLDIMRRGEGLRFEDVMLLENSIFFNMANVDDRHRDMRMDVDNMSYEELLALGERIGNVCTGLKEETIIKNLKQSKFVESKPPRDVETEPCCICREEYARGDNIGTLDCGHDFHRECIKKWLMQKNLCPICKTTGLASNK